ncbi:MAG: proline dehydrogenase family protein [Candidatus Neomarinimicrobiota bacterium]
MKLINNLIIQILPFLPKFLVKIVASPYIAGITDEEMLQNVEKLNQKGFKVAIDILGEHVQTENEAKEVTDRYVAIYDEISKRNLLANLSIKLTHVGQDLGLDIVEKNLSKLVEAAKKNNNFLRLDMENAPYTSETIKLYKEMFNHYDQIGIVIQAYLHRSIDDIKALSNDKFNVRICKGIYVEDPSLVLNDYNDIRDNYISLVKKSLNNGSYVGIATHDEFLIDSLYSWILEKGISKDRYEFQVLHGVPMQKKLKKLMDDGNTVRVYLPYGDNWYDYSVRRLKENPKMAGYIIKNLFSSIFRLK